MAGRPDSPTPNRRRLGERLGPWPGPGLLLLAVLAGCRPAGVRTTPYEAVDSWGRAVALGRAARRIVSLSPSTTEVVFALGLDDRLVGRTTWCDFPPHALAVPSVGDGLAPNVEAVAARQPDLVLLYASAANRPALDRLGALGISVAVLSLDVLADIGSAARLVGALTGRAAAAESLVAAMDSSLEALSAGDGARRPVAPGLRLYVHVWSDPPVTVGRGSYLAELVRAAGAVNLFDDLAAASATVSIEAIAARDPDAVLLLASDTLRAPDLRARPPWRAVRAVREGRVVVVGGSLFTRPSPRAPQAVRALRARLARLAGDA